MKTILIILKIQFQLNTKVLKNEKLDLLDIFLSLSELITN